MSVISSNRALKFAPLPDDTSTMDFSSLSLPASIEARIPAEITVHGLTALRGIENRDTLRYFATLPIKELRRRQDLTRQQQAMAFKQEQRQPSSARSVGELIAVHGFDSLSPLYKGIVQLAITEDLLLQAIGLISFDDWVVPAQVGADTVEYS